MPQLFDDPDLYLNYDEPEDEAHGSYKETCEDVWDDEEGDDCDCDDDCDCGHDHSGNHPGESFFRK